ncbi:cilia- and flagella-associated protein 46 isoform X2 [Gambusia affinis]|uniref:cilia- and flagella-associated protein 46 isoform X2 n=1 Tax=Gambusia affinis TaxID=33528 RepID=UPI001CDCC2A6|nr:cilia- and flagella-associated protein 46 isoform X2 [Gambusia affinis]
MEFDIREHLAQVQQTKDFEALQSAYRLIKDSSAGASGPRIPLELYVMCAENALQMEHVQICFECLNMYFESDPPHDQFFCRALMCQGQLMSLFVSPSKSVKDIKEAARDFLKAIEIAKKDPSTHFLVFNTSVLYFQGVRPLLQPGLCHHLIPSLKQVVKGLEEVADQDHSWRAELMIQLVKCILDSGELEDCASYAKVTGMFIKSHTPYLYPGFYTLQVQEKLLRDDELLEISRQSNILKVIYEIQQFKIGWKERNENVLTEADSVKLREIFSLLVDSAKVIGAPVHSGSEQIPTPIQPCDRTSLLLELALLSLQVKDQEVAVDCWEQLKLAEKVNIDQRVMMQCVNCEINLLKIGAKMNDYSKASVEARLKEIEKLDQWLEAAVKEGRHRAAQALCASQWNLCLPLLQHNLRKSIKMPLLKLALVLEYTQSMSMEMRCEVHSELAVIEEEEGDLKASLSHLEKALLLDSGKYQERLLSALHLLQLRRTPYHTPACPLDKAAKIMQQVRDIPPHQSTDRRPLLVSVGLLLAPFDFQTVLDADHHTKFFSGSLGTDPLAVLAAKAQHHSNCVEKLNDYLDRQAEDTDNTVRVKLWATLAKTARKLEVWDVCRAACRFCLLYDDRAVKTSETNKSKTFGRGSAMQSFSGILKCPKLLHLLAEICFINAEATILQLLEEGVHLNSPAAPPTGEKVHFAEDDQKWILYRDWIQSLSAYATQYFLRGGEIGMEIGEHCLVENAAIYLWNYNAHMLAAEEYKLLLPTFQNLMEMLLKTKDISDLTMCAMVCNAAIRGLIQSASVRTSAKEKHRGSKQDVLLDDCGLQNIKKALELCEYALRISSGDRTRETVPIAVRKLVLTSWVQIKQLLHQQIGEKLDLFKDKNMNKTVAAMSRVLVGLEMLNCNKNPKHMDFSVPSLSTLAGMASECSWPDAVVELQVWCQLAAFCHRAEDHSLVLHCTQKAFQLEKAAADSLTTAPYLLYGQTAVNEMLSSAACLRGLSLVCMSSGNLDKYREALKVILSGVSIAEKTGSQDLCVTAAVHFWNACLPLTQSPRDKWWLREHLEKIHNTLLLTRNCPSKSKTKSWTMREMPQESPSDGSTKDTKEICLRTNIICLLVSIYMDKEDFTRSLKLLDKAMVEMAPSKHRLKLFKTRILLKVLLGECIEIDMELLHKEGEQCCSVMWHQAAIYGITLKQSLTCYQNAIRRLTSKEFEWQKVNLLLEFGGWLYFHNFPKSDAQLQVQWAIDILLHLEQKQEATPDESVLKHVKTEQSKSLIGVHGQFTQNLSNLKEVCVLDQLTQAHTLLAIMADRSSPEHQQNLLQAYTFVLQIWQVSLATVSEILSEMMKIEPIPSPTDAAKKGKGKGKGKEKGKDKGKEKGKGKGKDKDKDKHKGKDKGKDKDKELVSTDDEEKATMEETVPSTLKEWAQYVCPEQIRQIFKTTDSPHCINKYTFLDQHLSLFYLRRLERELCSLSLDHLTLPILHLAEIISLDLLQRRSLSDLYRLRIAYTCVELGFGSHSPYQEMLHSLSKIQINEQMNCRREVSLSELRRLDTAYHQISCFSKYQFKKAEEGEHISSGQLGAEVSTQDIWLEKAEVCLSLGLYQSTRQLLGEAHMVAKELGDERAEAKSLVCMAALACEEQNFAQALLLLDKIQIPKGEHDFWYQLTITRVTAVVGLRDKDSQTKVDQTIKQGCEALQLIAGLQVNRVQELRSMISSLENRGAVECIRAISNATTAETSSTEVIERLTAACETLRLSAVGLTKFNFGQQAAEAHRDCAYGLRILAGKVTDVEMKHRYLLDALSQMHLAVTQQEHVILSAQRLFSPQKSCNLSQKSIRKLLDLRMYMTELCMEILEANCAKHTQEVFARLKKTAIEIILEEFIRDTPEPYSTEMDCTECTDRTLEQKILSQLAALNFQTFDNMEVQARCLNVQGRYLKVLAMLRDPMYVKALWHKQDALPDSNVVPTTEENSGKGSDPSSKEPGSTSDRGAEQQWKDEAQELLAEASKVLSESATLCLQHNLPSAILAEASFHMLDCNGQSDPTVTSQYLALYQSCCTVAMAAKLLNCACADTSVSQLSALLSLHRNLFVSQEMRSSSMLKRSEEQLLHLFKAFHQLTIIPNHLDILPDIPPNMKILLLQHSNDGSELFGCFYETTKAPENLKAKTPPHPALVPSSQVAKVSVCPQALRVLREQTQVFGLENKHSVLEDESSQLETSKVHQNTTRDKELELHFGEIVEKMEDYLNPLLSQFDYPFIRSQTATPPISENEQTQVKEEKCSLDKVDNGDHLVVLADRKLLELPLEALPLLQEEGLASVSRDFSLQLFFSRLSREQSLKVESDSKKEPKTKGGKGAKKKGVKSKAIKAAPPNPVLPSYTFTMDTTNLKYIVDPYKEGQSEMANLTSTMKEVLEQHKQHLPQFSKNFFSRPSLFEIEQVLCKCSAFIYMGMDPLLESIPPAKVASFNLTDCRMALLFDRIQIKVKVLPNNKIQESADLLILENPLETALLLSLTGVNCIVLNQWHDTLQQKAQHLTAVLDKLLRVKETSGHTIHSLKGREHTEIPQHKVTETNDQDLTTDSKENKVQHTSALTPAAYNCILYGLPNYIVS